MGEERPHRAGQEVAAEEEGRALLAAVLFAPTNPVSEAQAGSRPPQQRRSSGRWRALGPVGRGRLQSEGGLSWRPGTVGRKFWE